LLAVASEAITLDLSTYFLDADQVILEFSVTGLPEGSGLALTGTEFGGVPSVADVSASQPIVVTVTAQDAAGASATKTLPVFVAAGGACLCCFLLLC
jgi:hypothetical protein